jgi:hypothetical protein
MRLPTASGGNRSRAVSLTGIGIILFVIGLGVGAWLTHEKNEKRKHELWVWIEKSYWGTATEGKYKSLREEQLALERI